MPHEIEASWQENNPVSGPQSSLPEDSQGAPLRRSPRGLPGRALAWTKSPEVAVWSRPLFRVVGMVGVLGCVAFLGKQSEEESNYGPRVELPSAAPNSRPLAPSPTDAQEGQLSQTAEAQPTPPPCTEQKQEKAPPAVLPDGRIIMNEASQDDFTRLPGVGEARAKSIVELRARMGKFRKVTDLLRVRGIGWKTLQSMKDLLVVDRPPQEEKEEQSRRSSGDEVSQGLPPGARASGTAG